MEEYHHKNFLTILVCIVLIVGYFMIQPSEDIKLYNIRQEKSYKGYVHTEYMTIRKAGDLYVSGQVKSKVVIGGKYLFLA